MKNFLSWILGVMTASFLFLVIYVNEGFLFGLVVTVATSIMAFVKWIVQEWDNF